MMRREIVLVEKCARGRSRGATDAADDGEVVVRDDDDEEDRARDGERACRRSGPCARRLAVDEVLQVFERLYDVERLGVNLAVQEERYRGDDERDADRADVDVHARSGPGAYRRRLKSQCARSGRSRGARAGRMKRGSRRAPQERRRVELHVAEDAEDVLEVAEEAVLPCRRRNLEQQPSGSHSVC